MAGDTPFAPDTTDASGVALPEPRLTTLRIGRVEAADFARDPRNGRDDTFHVMAANYDPDGEAGEWDGITAEDIITATREDGTIDLDILGSWGPFELWHSGAYAPIVVGVPTTAEWSRTVAASREADAATDWNDPKWHDYSVDGAPPVCGVPYATGYAWTCDLPANHDGDHEAPDGDGTAARVRWAERQRPHQLPTSWVTREHTNGARFTASPATHADYDAMLAAIGERAGHES